MNNFYNRFINLVLTFIMIISCSNIAFTSEITGGEKVNTDMTLEFISPEELKICNDVTQSYFMVIFGYAIVDNEKYIYVCTDLINPVFSYLKWGTDTLRMRSVNIF